MSGRSKVKATAAHPSLPASRAGDMPEAADSRLLTTEKPAAGGNNRWLVSGVCLFLAAIVWLVFGQTLHHEFVNLDDNLYVYENPVVQKGLTWEGFRWALTYGAIGHWHPLTWLSHMLDCQWYGLQAGGHHLTNILLHTVTVILLFLVLRRMTGFLWRSAFVAAVFAIHPLRVESVAWVSERKDVLSAFFFMLTLLCYTKAVTGNKWPAFAALRRGKQVTRTEEAAPAFIMSRITYHVSRITCPVSPYYYLGLLFFALGLLSKNMLVTTPFVLLLLDYWPLGRFSSFTPRVVHRLVAEKIPLFVLTVGSCVATALVPEKVTAAEALPFGLRMENVVVSYVTYLWQMIHPAGLACVYPNPTENLPIWQVGGAVGLLLAMSGLAWALRRTHPWLVVGWFWYLGMMIPVIGMVQISHYAHADRYTYLPQIGLYLMLTWSAAEWCAGWRHRRLVLGGLSTVIVAGLIFCARVQTAYWQNSESLWTHTLACTSDNLVAHNNLGNVLVQKGRVDEAIAHYQMAIQIKPDYEKAYGNLGNALFQKGEVDEAMVQYQKALQIEPNDADVHNNLGNALLQKGQVDKAIAQCQKALQIKPDLAEACDSLGNAFFQKGEVDEAIVQYQKALQIKPDYAGACYNLGHALFQKGRVDEAIVQYQMSLQINPNFSGACDSLGNALLQKGRTDEAIAQYQKALQINPDSVDVLNNLAWLLATSPDAHLRDGVQAVQYAGRACELTHHGVTLLVGTLAAAYAEAGRFDEAVVAAQKACALATAAGEPELLKRNQELLELYRAHQPYHEAVAKVVPAAP